MSEDERVCPTCGWAEARKHGRDRRGRQLFRCCACRGRCTALTATPFSAYRCPPDSIALAVRWYVRQRLRYADVAELLAERGVRVDPSTIDAWVRAFTPLDEDAARPCRTSVGNTGSVDATSVNVAGDWVQVYRAIDGQGQIVDVYVSRQRAAEDAATCFRRAIAATGVAPAEVTTDRAATDPPALAAVLPDVLHEAGKAVQQRVERDHQHRKGRVCGMRGCKTLTGARVLCRAHAFVRNLRGHFYDLRRLLASGSATVLTPVLRAWHALTADLLAR